jgi:hypothetical protein
MVHTAVPNGISHGADAVNCSTQYHILRCQPDMRDDAPSNKQSLTQFEHKPEEVFPENFVLPVTVAGRVGDVMQDASSLKL